LSGLYASVLLGSPGFYSSQGIEITEKLANPTKLALYTGLTATYSFSL